MYTLYELYRWFWTGKTTQHRRPCFLSMTSYFSLMQLFHFFQHHDLTYLNSFIELVKFSWICVPYYNGYKLNYIHIDCQQPTVHLIATTWHYSCLATWLYSHLSLFSYSPASWWIDIFYFQLGYNCLKYYTTPFVKRICKLTSCRHLRFAN